MIKRVIDFYFLALPLPIQTMIPKDNPKQIINLKYCLLFTCRLAKVYKIPWQHQRPGLRMSLPVTSVTKRHYSSVTVVRSVYAATA